MRMTAILGTALAATLLASANAGAENRTFIVPNNPDAYGTDRCLANGERCGAVIATAYCQSHAFEQAKSFQRIAKDEITGALPASGKDACVGNCDSYVAIICSR